MAFTTDLLVLVALVVISAWPYVGHLGFYSDDWSFIGPDAAAPGPSLSGTFGSIHGQFPERPAMSVYFALLIRLFGAHPLGYHLVNHGMLAFTGVVFHLTLRRLGAPRVIALAWPAVWLLLPHYATDRLWFSTVHAHLSVAAYFLSLYAGLAARTARPGSAAVWRAASLAALGVSVLAYEVIAPWFLLNPLIEQWACRAAPDADRQQRRTAAALAAVAVALGAAFAYKLQVTPRVAVDDPDYRQFLTWLVRSAYEINLVELGWRLPDKVLTLLRLHGARVHLPAALAVAAVLGAGVWQAAQASLARISRAAWLGMTAAGVVLVGLGYSAFVVTSHVGFSITGMNNRTAIAAAIGVALTATGAWGALTSLAPKRWRALLFAAGVAALGAAGAVFTTVVASYWGDAAEAQQRLMAQLREDVPELPPGTRLLLDGVCPYRGPGTVFETDWDTTGLVQFLYRDRSLTGDVLRPRAVVGADAVVTGIYSTQITNPYGPSLRVYDVDRRVTAPLADGAAAAQYFAASRAVVRPPCPPGSEGNGAPIF